ncbi:MAG: methylated-DNA--[protein]-cysteine S-methyltransferase [Bacteroidales bacterium]|nr:methylated-DNA--[protein]-cysteine S-methyltransferase [Bacteroidales bacterium]
MLYKYEHTTPVGEIVIAATEEALVLCDWKCNRHRLNSQKRIEEYFGEKFREEKNETIEKTIVQLREYFEKKRKEFDIPLLLIGTEFQKRIWKLLMGIEYGETIAYSTLAERHGDKKAVRGVAQAVGKNPISIIVPCHRIIGKNGTLTGYAGGVETKNKLLNIEGITLL